jgi:hypothetical protein
VGGGIAKRASLTRRKSVGSSGTAAMGLGVVLNKLQIIFGANLPYPIGIGTATIEVHYHDGTGTRRDGLLNEAVVNLERVE